MSNLLETLGIRQLSLTKNKIILALTISDAHLQPYGILHGGVNAVMAETAASLGANANLDDAHVAVGVDITTHHLRAVKAGTLTATATPVNIGHTLQVWQVNTTVNNQLTSTSTVTLMVQPKPNPK